MYMYTSIIELSLRVQSLYSLTCMSFPGHSIYKIIYDFRHCTRNINANLACSGFILH